MNTEQTINAIVSLLETKCNGRAAFQEPVRVGEYPFNGCTIYDAQVNPNDGSLYLRCGDGQWNELKASDFCAAKVAEAVHNGLKQILPVIPSYADAYGDAI